MIVNVIDDRMGMSKTSAMIEYMKKYSNQKNFIFVKEILKQDKLLQEVLSVVKIHHGF